MNRLLVLLLTALLCQLSLAADVYKTVDEHGNVTYSDTPKNSASEKVELKESNSLPAPAVTNGGQTKDRPNTVPNSYTIAITSPADEYHVMPGEFSLPINASVTPNLHATHRLIYTDNGAELAGNQIEFISPGAHAVGAKVVDANNKVLGQSSPVTVYVHRPTVKPKPTPKPKN